MQYIDEGKCTRRFGSFILKMSRERSATPNFCFFSYNKVHRVFFIIYAKRNRSKLLMVPWIYRQCRMQAAAAAGKEFAPVRIG